MRTQVRCVDGDLVWDRCSRLLAKDQDDDQRRKCLQKCWPSLMVRFCPSFSTDRRETEEKKEKRGSECKKKSCLFSLNRPAWTCYEQDRMVKSLFQTSCFLTPFSSFKVTLQALKCSCLTSITRGIQSERCVTTPPMFLLLDWSLEGMI